ncbi:MAG: N-acetyltransferase [Desulfobacteraceae bacterium]|nr:N-acetyltransferase [Desulfobacteraceae bacterium]
MIRRFKQSDMEQILQIWLSASQKAHDFIKKDFWESKVDDMRDIYLPASETYVYDEGGTIKGFVSLYEETLAAMFVSMVDQGRGIGKQLMVKAKQVRENLSLSVYKENNKSIEFYKKCGFKIKLEQIDGHTGMSELLMVFSPL